MNPQKLRRSSIGHVRRKWIVSCMSLSIVPIIIGVVIFLFNRREYRQQTLSNNEVLLTQVQSLLDLNLYDIRIIAENVSSCPELENFSQQLHQEQPQRSFAKKLLRESLAQYAKQNSYIDSIYLYFWETDEIVTDKTAAKADVIYRIYHQNLETSYEQWFSLLNQTYQGNSVVLPLASGGYTLAYIKSLPAMGFLTTRVSVVVMADREKLIQMADSISEKSGCHWNIQTGTGEFVLPSTNVMQQLREPISGSAIQRVAAADSNVLSLLRSTTMDIVYWIQTPPKVYAEGQQTINILFFIGLSIIFVGSICFTAWFVSNNYSPIRKLLQLVPQWENPNLNGQMDEYTAIMEAFSSTKMASTRLQEKLSQQDALLTDASLTLLLKKSPYSTSEREALERLQKTFPYPYITVILLRPGGLQGTIEEKDHGAYSQQEEAFQLILQQIGQNICQSSISGQFRVLKQEENMSLVLNTDLQLHEEKREYFQEIAQRLNRWALENRQTPPVFAASKSREGLQQLSACYEEAEYALKYQLVFGASLEEEQKIASRLRAAENVYYSAEEESKLMGALLSGDTAQSQAILKEIWNNNEQTMRIAKPFLFCLLYQLTGTLLRASNLLPNASGMEHTLRDAIEQLRSADGTQRAYHCVEELLLEVCALYAKEHSLATHRLKNDILRYIDEHYDDINLSVESLCNIFGKSRTYLFSLFKEDTGFSLMYHIARVRIENAKRLLTTTDDTIQEISQKVGFNSAMSFTRAFKKYENIAPSKYREFNQRTVNP